MSTSSRVIPDLILSPAPWERVSKTTFDEDNWELYDITKDFSEATDLAKQNPAKLTQLQNLFLKEAKKYKVLPLDDRLIQRFDVKTRSNLTTGRNSFTYYTSVAGIPEGSAPNIKNRSFSITADVDAASSGTEGVLVTQGGRFAGWSFFLQEGKPTFAYNLLNSDVYDGLRLRTIIQSSQPITIGKSKIKFDCASAAFCIFVTTSSTFKRTTQRWLTDYGSSIRASSIT